MKKFICYCLSGYHLQKVKLLPEKCPLCKAAASKFKEMEEAEGGLRVC